MQPLKNHYRVLNIPFSATEDDIKKAFRKLALQYHPDRNNDTQSVEKFIEIEYAYNILSGKRSKAEYDHSLLAQNAQFRSFFSVSTPADILILAENLSKKIQRIDAASINRDLLFFEIENILSTYNVEILLKADDAVTNRKILLYIIVSARPLRFPEMRSIIEQLKSITINDSIARKELLRFIDQSKQRYYWDRYKIYFAIAAAIIFCVLVFFLVNE